MVKCLFFLSCGLIEKLICRRWFSMWNNCNHLQKGYCFTLGKTSPRRVWWDFCPRGVLKGLGRGFALGRKLLNAKQRENAIKKHFLHKACNFYSIAFSNHSSSISWVTVVRLGEKKNLRDSVASTSCRKFHNHEFIHKS